MPCSRIVLEHIFNRPVEKDNPQHETAHSHGKDGCRYGNESLWLSWDVGLLDLSRHSTADERLRLTVSLLREGQEHQLNDVNERG